MIAPVPRIAKRAKTTISVLGSRTPRAIRRRRSSGVTVSSEANSIIEGRPVGCVVPTAVPQRKECHKTGKDPGPVEDEQEGKISEFSERPRLEVDSESGVIGGHRENEKGEGAGMEDRQVRSDRCADQPENRLDSHREDG